MKLEEIGSEISIRHQKNDNGEKRVRGAKIISSKSKARKEESEAII